MSGLGSMSRSDKTVLTYTHPTSLHGLKPSKLTDSSSLSDIQRVTLLEDITLQDS